MNLTNWTSTAQEHSSKQPSHQNTLSTQSWQKKIMVFAMLLALFCILILKSNEANAVPCPAFGPTTMQAGTGTDLAGYCAYLNSTQMELETAVAAKNSVSSLQEQILQYGMQGEQLAKEVLAAQNLVLQTEMMIRDLEENPLNVVVPSAALLIDNQNRIHKLAADIVNNSGSIGDNLAKNLTNPKTTQLGQGSRLELWSDARVAGIKETFGQYKHFLKTMEKDVETQKDLTNKATNAKTAMDREKATAQILGEIMRTLQLIRETLNQQAGMSATEAAILQEKQNAAHAQLIELMRNKKPGSTVKFAPDGYDGPSQTTNSAF